MPNQALVSHLKLIAQLMQLDGENHFKVVAFNNAAESIELMSSDVTRENTGTVPGVGTSIKIVIEEFLSLGTSTRLVALTQRWPVEALTMTRVHGVGPKTAMKLYREGLKNFTMLLDAAKQGHIMNPKLRAAVIAAEDTGRVPYVTAERLAQHVMSQMAPHVEKAEACGSIRRLLPNAKDIDIVVMVKSKEQAESALAEFAKLGEHVSSGSTRGSIRVSRYGVTMNCDMWVCEPWHWGAMLNYVTGSKEHNIFIRGVAKQKNLLVNEYGIWKDGERLGGEDEHDVYRILGIEYVEPWERKF